MPSELQSSITESVFTLGRETLNCHRLLQKGTHFAASVYAVSSCLMSDWMSVDPSRWVPKDPQRYTQKLMSPVNGSEMNL